ncbi:Galactose oxidase/kelch beta-propeller [Penicillium cf. griseofulvum]|uniref:Galactose oxidase/kelch beta-propeller n=1 Tax=Penicillium cf. griseofulvum TaxID=2972120 RepID=A0A9W9IZH7_9EURO|nr:Galactose oxidase/kelch beta-propeller [Penicillium cf. griseofulvum]KAJ5430434.1 Galactose oxidase/kelch beta-propeller [Penicillium cf. griseofulvum]KAJ5435796.1 Galactose oxidase/kelch beta-propeller [Penicillium cf. griseofulvum]
MKQKAKALLLVLLALVDPSSAIPYTPSSIFLSPQHNDSLAYILRPSPTGETEFVSLNLSSSIDAENLSYHTLLKNTPFNSSNQNSSFVPAINDQGVITVYSGNCHSVFDNPALWKFHPNSKSLVGNGTWDRLPVITSDAKTAPNYLAAGFTYSSSYHEDESSMYAFGGMCPFANSTDETWISAANYSRSTVVIGPSPYYNTKYNAATTGKRAPPIAEAGMAVVPLQPTYSAGSTGKQQDFLFIGGHTREAFLNMSQLAIFSLPQQSWSFVSVISDSTPKTELTVRDTVSVEPRSGHTAVLSEDGNKVFVFGGWVGNMTVPAEPQFAVLDLAEGFGGASEWIWTAPSFERLGIAEGAGIFGHGAAMLPGGVMMISGGYNIPKPSSKRVLATAQSNSRVYLYNVTSNSWVTSYRNPAASSSTHSSKSSSKLSSSQKAGLGIGLGIGCPAAIAIVLCGWNYHRKRRVKSKRDSQLRELALGAERAHFWDRDCPTQASSIRSSGMSEKRDVLVYPWSASRSQTARPNWKDQGGGTAERTGLLMDPTAPSKNKRPPVVPPVNNRSFSYRNSEYRRSDTASDIHPIDEREEDEAIFREHLLATIPPGTRPTVKSTEADDPFSDTPYATPRSTIFGVGLGPFYSRRKGIGSMDAESLTKSEQTATNMSDNTAFSFASSQPIGKVNQARAILVDRPISWGSGHPSLEYFAVGSTNSDPDNAAPSEKSVSADSYSTAQTNLSHRQSENESLLFDALDSTTAPSSPSKLPRESKPKASDWVMNTMRRALTMSRRSPDSQLYSSASTSTAHRASGIDRRSTLLGSSHQSTASGPSTPRRAVSASAELFRRKQGAKDWNARKRVSDDVFNTARSTRDDLFIGAPGYLGDEAGFGDDEEDVHDWDLEGAAEGRRVQMTFTVPREKLRVVNATARDIDSMSERSVSWGTGNRRVST